MASRADSAIWNCDADRQNRQNNRQAGYMVVVVILMGEQWCIWMLSVLVMFWVYMTAVICRGQ